MFTKCFIVFLFILRNNLWKQCQYNLLLLNKNIYLFKTKFISFLRLRLNKKLQCLLLNFVIILYTGLDYFERGHVILIIIINYHKFLNNLRFDPQSLNLSHVLLIKILYVIRKHEGFRDLKNFSYFFLLEGLV